MHNPIADIITFWNATTALDPYPLWLSIAPENTPKPYVLLVAIGSQPNYLTCKSFWESFSFQLHVFATSNIGTIVSTISDNLDYVHIAASTISMERTNFVLLSEAELGQAASPVSHAILSYNYYFNASLV